MEGGCVIVAQYTCSLGGLKRPVWLRENLAHLYCGLCPRDLVASCYVACTCALSGNGSKFMQRACSGLPASS